MQAPPASKTKKFIARFGLSNLIWGAIFVGLLLCCTVIWLWPYRKLPTATWREANAGLPWNFGSVAVEDLRGSWRSSAGHERMALRAAYYPVAKLTLGDCTGSGMLYLRFTDSHGRQAGDIVSLRYRDGAFVPRTETNINAAGKSAEVHVEAGFDSKDDLTLHRLDENMPLWRVSVACLPDGAATAFLMGFVTIPAEEEGGES